MTLEGFFALSEDDHEETEAERDERLAFEKIATHTFVQPKPGTTLADLGIVPAHPAEEKPAAEAEAVPASETEPAAGVITPDVDRKMDEREKILRVESKEAKRKKKATGAHTPRPRYQNGGHHTSYD